MSYKGCNTVRIEVLRDQRQDIVRQGISCATSHSSVMTKDEETLITRYRALDTDDQEIARAFLLKLIKRASL